LGKLDGKVAIVTGGGSGIGKGIAQGLVAEGAKTVVAARGSERLNNAVEELQAPGATVVAIRTDVTDEMQVEALFAETVGRFGRLDVLVNCAGAFDGGPLDEISAETWDKVIATNLRGPFLCTRAAMRIMKRQKVGRILNIGSISAQRPRLHSGPYSASKFGLWGLTIVTALEGRGFGISACCLHPGNVRVESSPEEVGAVCAIPGYSSEPMMEVENVAEVAVLMACLPFEINMLEAIVMPVKQAYLARG
jgi:NAD(P)-dependent dehydrogenase (short-subunit alcohol dehydrogenase family)